MANKRQRCFVIMPFSKTTEQHTAAYWTSHFEDFLKPLIEENPELEAYRSKPLRVDILREIITHLVVSPVVVADLTDSNPNVYWELGIRQSFKHGTVTIAEAGPSLPFDVSVKGTLFYHPGDHIQTAKFSRDFKEAIEDCLANPDRPDSHVLETISGRGTLFEIFRRDEAIRRLDAVLSESNGNIGILKGVIKSVQTNQKNPSKRTVVTERFRSSAVELLITNRYIDEEQSFYKLAEKYLDRTMMINSQLELWEHSPNATEKWLLEQKDSAMEIFKNFKDKMTNTRGEIGKRF
ncbi:hypothetical protein KAW65_00505 [candidate division WOR-3 bacterium]|nr:hypothetical protein [candidate division WOR-3 bacterium]